MSQTGAGGNKDLTETVGGEATSDVDHFDELDIDIKLEEEEESDDQTNDEGPKVITIKNFEKLGGYVMCDQCPARLKSMVNLERHMRNKHAPTTFCCSKCDKTFDNKKKLDDHERTHQILVTLIIYYYLRIPCPVSWALARLCFINVLVNTDNRH